jgi:putative ABC transport system ATP-binding protein
VSLPLVTIQQVWKQYRLGKVTVDALRGINLTVQPGEFLAIVGPSGSGKTTVLNLIGCLDTPTSGTVVLDGVEVDGLRPAQLAELRSQKIGFIFQSFNLIPVLSASENVEYPLLIQGLPAAQRHAATAQALEHVGLAALARHRPGELSGGQQQRVAIARALVTSPSLILADEPTANLDSQTAQEIIAFLLRLNRTQGVTCIFSTHDPRVMQHASRIVEMCDGQIVPQTYSAPGSA